MHLAARHPDRVRSLSLHSAWDMSDRYLNTVVELWRSVATTRPTVADAVVDAVFPLCFTPDMYVNRPDLADALAEFGRSRPAQPLCAFLAQTEAAMTRDASVVLGEIAAPSQMTVGALDLVCSPRFRRADRRPDRDSELVVFERLSHAGCTRMPSPSTARPSTSSGGSGRRRAGAARRWGPFCSVRPTPILTRFRH